MNIKITNDTAGIRLDKFLVAYDSIWPVKPSRSQIQKMIEQGLITVNKKNVSSHYGLKAGDVITIQKAKVKSSTTSSRKKLSGKTKLIEITDETSDYLVINKPAGLAVHGVKDLEYTLADWLKEKYPGIVKVGEDPERPGIVHRLDKDVSGLMVIAKTQPAFDCLKKQFQSRSIIKEYTALVHGQIPKAAGLINFPIRRSREGYKMAALPFTEKGEPSSAGRNALTEFMVTKKFINYTLLKVKIKTGRTHQIRVHLAAYDHPVVGDPVYGTARSKTQNKKLGLNRIFLIADHLSFTGLTGEKKDLRIGLTDELKNILKIIK